MMPKYIPIISVYITSNLISNLLNAPLNSLSAFATLLRT